MAIVWRSVTGTFADVLFQTLEALEAPTTTQQNWGHNKIATKLGSQQNWGQVLHYSISSC